MLAALAADIAACNATRETAIQNCRDLYPNDPVALDQCIDNAQVEAFQCRDTAREARRPDIENCRALFRACAQACPPPQG